MCSIPWSNPAGLTNFAVALANSSSAGSTDTIQPATVAFFETGAVSLFGPMGFLLPGSCNRKSTDVLLWGHVFNVPCSPGPHVDQAFSLTVGLESPTYVSPRASPESPSLGGFRWCRPW